LLKNELDSCCFSIKLLDMKSRFAIYVALLFIGGCGSAEPPAAEPLDISITPPPADAQSPSDEMSSGSSSSSSGDLDGARQETLISPTGIGQAQLGMTLGDLKTELGDTAEFMERSPFMVGFDAVAVSRDGVVLYYILHLAGEPLEEEDIIQGLLTDNPEFQTLEGVGPGTLIQTGEAIYGEATLSYNTDNESREYVRFEGQPAANLSFGTGVGGDAGVYSNPVGGFNETQEYHEDAAIQAVLLVCLTETCAIVEAE
jgi:hypothetical protein